VGIIYIKKGVSPMKWIKRIFILALVLAVIGFGGLTLYEEAYSILEPVSVAGLTVKQTAGYSVGYDSGYSVGQKDGYSLGKQEGYGEVRLRAIAWVSRMVIMRVMFRASKKVTTRAIFQVKPMAMSKDIMKVRKLA